MSKKHKYLFGMLITLFLTMLFFSNIPSTSSLMSIELKTYKNDLEEMGYTTFLENVDSKKVNTIYYDKDGAYFYLQLEEKDHKVVNPEYESFKKDMLEKNLTIKTCDEFNDLVSKNLEEKVSSSKFIAYLPVIICFVLTLYLTSRYVNTNEDDRPRAHNTNERTIPFGPSPTQNNVADKGFDTSAPKHTFDDVAGLVEVKKDVCSLVDFLRNKDKYVDAGAKLPKGVIFYGPPGTGKTLLAKAIAGEAKIPFIYMSGSDFVEMYVGVGAKRVRALFAEAKKKAPCIIFIDEIDAIGGKRTGEDTNGEDRKTLNALLAEMDGFKANENIIVIGATNTIESLDPALLRPGRFTNKYCVPLPATASERYEIIRLYTKNKKFAEDVNFHSLAKETMGFSPAAIEYLLNEAAIISVQDNKKFIDNISIDKAMTKVLLSGHIKENQNDRDKNELKVVAWHEAGHTLMGKLNGKDIPKVTIMSSTSGAGGVTFTTPKTESGLYTVEDLENEVKELYAGRIAEKLMNGNTKITTGASNDIERATHIIKSIITSYGMSDEFGLLNLNQLKVSQDIIIEKEVELAKRLENEATEQMKQYFDILKQIACNLLENETLYANDIDSIFNRASIIETLTSDIGEENKALPASL